MRRKRLARTWSTDGRAETLTLGAHADCIRIYDKAQERRSRRNHKQATDALSGSHQQRIADRAVITRIERQLCSKRMPDSLRSLGDLVQRAGSFRPFERLEILAGTSIPTIDQVGVRKGLLGRGLLWLIEERGGLPQATAAINRKNGNGARIVRDLQEFLPGAAVPMPDLDRLYQAGVIAKWPPYPPEMALLN
jgi:hypothetical protein